MTKIVTCLLLLTAIFLLASATPSHAGQPGRFATALKNQFCGGTSGSSWYGCYAYMHYRVDYRKNKDSAKSTCYKTGCGGKYGSSNPTQLSNCHKGCDQAYGADN